MNRRKFIALNGWFLGLSLATGGGLALAASSCNRRPEAAGDHLLGGADAAILNEMAETIIPTTDTPGGKQAKPGEYIVLTHNDCLDEEQRKANKEHLENLGQRIQTETGKSFLESSGEERIKVLERFEKEQFDAYMIYKRLIVSAYLSSEAGAAEFMKFSLVPGRYDGCTPERPW